MKEFEIIPHTADLQIKAYGKDKKELFKNALIGMFKSIEPIIKDQKQIIHEIDLDAPSLDILLIDFLSEALYLSDSNNEAYLDVEITEFYDKHIKAKLKGVKISGFASVEIKAVTYHDLNIKLENGLWQTDIVFDI